METLNSKLGINFWGNKNLEGTYKEAHFCDSNGEEFLCYMDDIIVEYYEDFIQDFWRLCNMESYEDLFEFLESNCGVTINNDLDESEPYVVTLKFNDITVKVCE